MPANYVLLEKITVGAAGASSVTFSSIPQTGYTDLVLQASTRAVNSGAQNFNISFNGSSTNFSSILLYGTGSVAASIKYPPNSPTNTTAVLAGSDFTANTFGSAEWYIPNYTGSTFKSFSSDSVTENNATLSFIEPFAQLWSNTAAITSITLAAQSGNLMPNSTFYLYGVAKLGTTPAIAPKATGGSIIETDGTYWYHAFLSSGTFTPATALSCDVLVVAGGGGTAAASNAGGGGAGGLLGFTSQSLTATGYTVTVGAGGAAGSQGANSQFGSLTASVGGGFGSGANPAGSGGSGAGGAATAGFAGGSATSGQGFAGGTGANSGSGGGGGSAEAGANGTTNNGGRGGDGTTAYSSWGLATTTGQNVGGTVYYAGGGGGWQASPRGGYGGGATQTGAGTANTGGGGGGYGGGTGGSGIVIVRYAV